MVKLKIIWEKLTSFSDWSLGSDQIGCEIALHIVLGELLETFLVSLSTKETW